MIIFRKLPKKGSVIIGLLVFIADQFSKFWILEYVGPGEITHVGPCLNFVLVFNPGVTFGLLKAYSNLHYLLLVAGVFVLSSVVAFWWYKAENIVQRYATSMILAGALGNLVDRLRFHAVVDFLDFYVFNWHWYTFNLADSAIVLGVVLMMLDSYCKPKNMFRY